MAFVNEVKYAADFVYDKLAAHSDVIALVQDRIFRDIAPPTANLPYITFTLISSVDKNAIGARKRLFTRPLFLVKAVTEGTDERPADLIASAIDDALMGQNDLVGTDGVVKLGVYREACVSYVEEEQGVLYRHNGGNYRLFVHKLPE
jgi:hypothetical protein